MFWRAFRKTPPKESPSLAWWRDANAAADALDFPAIERLTRSLTPPSESIDDAEREQEMLDGLTQLLALAGADTPVVSTQHRVIGADVCHFATPASLVGPAGGASGKLFVTSGRLIFAAGTVVATPWHRIRDIVRADRDLLVSVAGSGEPFCIRCNTYGDALVTKLLALRLRR